MNARMEGESAVPWWAAFGAPLLGVPILVGLLALGSPGEVSNPPSESESVITIEQVQATPTAGELRHEAEVSLFSRC